MPINLINPIAILAFFLSIVSSMAFAQALELKLNPQRPIIDLKTQKPISIAEFSQSLVSINYVLLGEFHDNPAHHQLRGELILRLKQPKQVIVVEYLKSGQGVRFEGASLESLQIAGFNAKAWPWNLYSPLFEQLRLSQRPIIGGNLDRSVSKAIFSKEPNPVPSSLQADYQKSGLVTAAVKVLEQDLIDGHCGKLPPAYLQPMMLVQRLTDISMAQELIKKGSGILLAGNGHIRKDYGVPQVLRAIAPNQSVISVGLIENEQLDPQTLVRYQSLYDYVWLTQGVQRKDPCLDLHFNKTSK